jgi:hypothetical protein
VNVAAWAWAAPVAALVMAVAAEASLDPRDSTQGTLAAGLWAGLYVSLAVAFVGAKLLLEARRRRPADYPR